MGFTATSFCIYIYNWYKKVFQVRGWRFKPASSWFKKDVCVSYCIKQPFIKSSSSFLLLRLSGLWVNWVWLFLVANSYCKTNPTFPFSHIIARNLLYCSLSSFQASLVYMVHASLYTSHCYITGTVSCQLPPCLSVTHTTSEFGTIPSILLGLRMGCHTRSPDPRLLLLLRTTKPFPPCTQHFSLFSCHPFPSLPVFSS